MGSWGKHENHIHTDLLRVIGEASYPPPFLQDVVVRRMKPTGDGLGPEVECKTPIFLPHILFHWSYHNNKKLFNRIFLGNMVTAQRQSMWQELLRRKDARVVDRPMREVRAWDSRAVPLGLHGDGVPVLQVGKAGSKSYETYSLQSMLASGPTNEIKMLLFGIYGDNISESPMRVIWKRLTWSLFFCTEESGRP